MDKYKEIHKTNDNSAKSQQYLDGLLNIPFGILLSVFMYKSIPLLTLFNTFNCKLS